MKAYGKLTNKQKKTGHKSDRVYIQQVAKPPCMKPLSVRLLNFCFIILSSYSLYCD